MSDDQVSAQDVPLQASEDWLESYEELPRRPRRRPLTPTALVLLGVLLLGCGFIGGALVEKGQSVSPASATSGGLAGLRVGGTTAGGANAAGGGVTFGRRFGAGASPGGGAGGGGGAGASGAIAIGQVAYVDGSTLYVEGAEGNTVRVNTSPASTVTKTVSATVRSIHPGETVVVQGTNRRGGSLNATTIRLSGNADGGGTGLSALFGR